MNHRSTLGLSQQTLTDLQNLDSVTHGTDTGLLQGVRLRNFSACFLLKSHPSFILCVNLTDLLSTEVLRLFHRSQSSSMFSKGFWV